MGCGRTHTLSFGACSGGNNSRTPGRPRVPPPWALDSPTPTSDSADACHNDNDPTGKACPRPFFLSAPSRCRYFTLLREPVARAVSAYEYFCRDCSEHSRFCSGDDPDPDQQLVLRSMQLKKNGKPRKNNRTIPGWAGRQGYDMKLPCPHMSLLEWTRAWGNLYVAELSGYNLELAAANPTTASAEWCSADHW